MMHLPFLIFVFFLSALSAFVLLELKTRRKQFRDRLAQAASRAPISTEAHSASAAKPPETLAHRLNKALRREGRRRRFETQIPDTLLLIASSLRAGHSLARAVQMVAEEMPAPMSDEFTLAFAEIGLGLPAAAVLARISARIQSPDWSLVVTAVTIQAQTGGNLAEILEHISETIRERVRVQGEIASLTAEGRLSALILSLLPPLLALLLTLRDPHYFHPLLVSPVGHLLIITAILGQILGTLWLRHMLRLEL